LEEIGGPTAAAGKEEVVAVTRMSREEGEERKKEERERGRRSHVPIQVEVSSTNPSDAIGGHTARDGWTVNHVRSLDDTLLCGTVPTSVVHRARVSPSLVTPVI
jgi:hypothetical protein